MFHVRNRIRNWLKNETWDLVRIHPYELGDYSSEGFFRYIGGLFIQSSIRIFLLIVLGTGFVVSVTGEPSIKLILAVAIPIIVYAKLDLSTLNDKRRTAGDALNIRIMVHNYKRRQRPRESDDLEKMYIDELIYRKKMSID